MITVAKAQKLEQRIITTLDKMGLLRFPCDDSDAPIHVDSITKRQAQTGTWYITIPHPTKSPFIIRLADHDCCYGGCSVSIDPANLTATQALDAMKKYFL